MIAAIRGSSDMIKILLEGKDIDVDIQENVGLPLVCTPTVCLISLRLVVGQLFTSLP